jgi:hypothetical protein
VAEKLSYASHYLETALDLTVCIKDARRPGVYIITVKGSKQADYVHRLSRQLNLAMSHPAGFRFLDVPVFESEALPFT